MKTLFSMFFLAAGLLMFASLNEAQAQPCAWQFCNTIDCRLSFRLYLTCPPSAPVAVSSTEIGGEGCWDTPTCRFFSVSQCNPPAGCNYSISINGAFYSDGDIICCSSTVPPQQCSPCNCAYVEIDPVNHTVSLVPATSGTNPDWDCNAAGVH